MSKPFRWDIARREQLGRLVEGEETPSYALYLDDLLECCARVTASCANHDLAFIGRSPEGIFDYLSGLLLDTTWARRLSLLNVSLRFLEGQGRKPRAWRGFLEHLDDMDLAPHTIAAHERGVALVDLVASGSTLGELVELMLNAAREAGVDPAAVRRRLRIVGITGRTHTSPKTWRWHQHAEWTKAFRPSAIKNVSVEWRLWGFLGNNEEKVSARNPPWRWHEQPEVTRKGTQLRALRLARRVFDAGCSSEHRERFAARLAEAPEMKERWLRALVTELRGTSRP